MTHPAQKPSSLFRTALTWSALAMLAAALLPVIGLGPALLERVAHAVTVGAAAGGESAAWGEIAFYMVCFAVPAAAAGGIIGALLGALVYVVRRECAGRSDARG